MPDGLDDELQTLRARAYGPDADIDGDPAALERLRELENDARSATAAVPVAREVDLDPADAMTDAAAPAFAASAVSAGGAPSLGAFVDLATEGEAADEGADDSPEDRAYGTRARTRPGAADLMPDDADPQASRVSDAAPEEPGDAPTDGEAATTQSRPWWRTRRAVAWMGAIAVVAVVGLAAAVWSTQAQGRVAVLQQTDLDGWPNNVMGEPPDGARLYEDYFGLTAVQMPQRWGSGEGMECLYIVESGGQGFMSTIGCAAGGFPPTAALLVSERGPEELRERFAEGTALQFVLRDGLVHVYAEEP
jgi:hypothetical protein